MNASIKYIKRILDRSHWQFYLVPSLSKYSPLSDIQSFSLLIYLLKALLYPFIGVL